MTKLVIVESPAKARTVANFLGDEYDVTASIGHIRDLPKPSDLPADMKKGPFGKFAVDVEHNFEPYYVVNADKKKKVSELKAALKKADELWLATDEDREGRPSRGICSKFYNQRSQLSVWCSMKSPRKRSSARWMPPAIWIPN